MATQPIRNLSDEDVATVRQYLADMLGITIDDLEGLDIQVAIRDKDENIVAQSGGYKEKMSDG